MVRHPEGGARMALDPRTVKAIKDNLARTPSEELRRMLKHRDGRRWSDEAFAAAEQLLDDRARGEAREPVPGPVPPPDAGSAPPTEPRPWHALLVEGIAGGIIGLGVAVFWVVLCFLPV